MIPSWATEKAPNLLKYKLGAFCLYGLLSLY